MYEVAVWVASFSVSVCRIYPLSPSSHYGNALYAVLRPVMGSGR